jgi:hypothetical protein
MGSDTVPSVIENVTAHEQRVSDPASSERDYFPGAR